MELYILIYGGLYFFIQLSWLQLPKKKALYEFMIIMIIIK